MTYKKAFLFVLIVQIVYFNQVLFNGEVIFPHNNSLEIGAKPVKDSHLQNRKFSDHNRQFIPALYQQLHGNHRAWLATWNPYDQLGRLVKLRSTYSRSYIITNLLSYLTDNPFRLYTMLTVAAVFLTGIFFFLLLKELGLHPLACSGVSLGWAVGVFHSYWLTFVQFIWTPCWTVCLLWLVTRYLKNNSYTSLIGISFATYCLLTSGRPQQIVMYLYVLVIFTLERLWRTEGHIKTKFFHGMLLFIASLSGVFMASPALADLAVIAQTSARVGNVGDEFFLAVVPKIHTIMDFGRFVSRFFDGFWFGNPINPNHPFGFNGRSFTPFYFCLLLLSWLHIPWRKFWHWYVFMVVVFVGAVWRPAHLFAVRYMGFHLSRSGFIGMLWLPAFIICGHVVDNIIRNETKKKNFLYLLPVPLFLMGILWYDRYHEMDVKYILLSCLLVLGTVLFIKTKNLLLFHILVIITVFVYGYPIMLTRPVEQIQVSSPLVERIRAELQDGFRYAKVGTGLSLPSNLESLLKLRSIHSYDSVSSRNYQRFVLKLSEKGTTTYGRYFDSITSGSKLHEEAFSYAGIGLLISKTHKLDPAYFIKIDEIDKITFYKPLRKPRLEAQIKNFRYGEDLQEVIVNGFLYEHNELQVEKTVSFDDFETFMVTPAPQETLLFVSRQFHPYWKAYSQKKNLTTVLVNSFFQGVVIPPNIREVTLEFKPYTLWGWVPQLIYALIGGILLFQLVLTRYVRKRTIR